ncbi:hypothetical protein [Amycolatopsis australiensis]|uniref:Uncharacterized protein n=1 Tax=Amycolatopsis australiensis TaxID=546364 RepID=A0A1K1RD90_9PSEU|nr:hypothetical protein [Amycolatopsis australiensis]SFW70016.1 hypothetical protein SAMN04489730_3056 [Amycolatopsis australiensis]
MDLSAADVVEELKVLRKGRGIFSTPLADRVGPALRAAFGIFGDDDSTAVRRKLTDGLRPLVESLPEDLKIALLAAFALDERARKPFYQERVHWAARTLDRDDRTVRRRIDEGIEHVAAMAVSAGEPLSRSRFPSRGWHTEELRVTLALDRPVPEAFEFRRVVADADEIAELDLALTLTAPGDPVGESDLEVDVFHGGVLAGRVMESSDRIGLALRLPAPLRRGERRDLGLRFRANLREPHYVCVPRHPCEVFDLHVRFGDRVPGRIVRLDKASQEDTATLRGPVLEPDGAGEVHVRFRDLAPGFAYGIRWQPGVTAG